MRAEDIRIGTDYAYREAPRRRGELEHVRVLERVRGKWRVEWVEPHPGLTDYVTSVHLVVPWPQRRAFLRDELRAAELAGYSATVWPGHNHPVDRAVSDVLDSTGEPLTVFKESGVLSGDPEAIKRVARRAGVPAPSSPRAYTDRTGTRHVPFDDVLELARAFARSEPDTVLLHLEVERRADETEVAQPGSAFLLPLVEESRAGWALARAWAGDDAALARSEAEIERLRRIIIDAMYELRHDGNEQLANTLARQLRGR